jgi:hypothetical protein
VSIFKWIQAKAASGHGPYRRRLAKAAAKCRLVPWLAQDVAFEYGPDLLKKGCLGA